jgi:zinc D-Ala-D-Ala carboxypeptidase
MKYFKIEEFACRHCGEVRMDPFFLGRIDRLREYYGKPLVVSSGYRCPIHNAATSGTGPTGPHTTGHAADFLVARGQALELLRVALSMKAFTGIGVQQKGVGRFIHLDDLPNAPGQPRPTLWSY